MGYSINKMNKYPKCQQNDKRRNHLLYKTLLLRVLYFLSSSRVCRVAAHMMINPIAKLTRGRDTQNDGCGWMNDVSG